MAAGVWARRQFEAAKVATESCDGPLPCSHKAATVKATTQTQMIAAIPAGESPATFTDLKRKRETGDSGEHTKSKSKARRSRNIELNKLRAAKYLEKGSIVAVAWSDGGAQKVCLATLTERAAGFRWPTEPGGGGEAPARQEKVGIRWLWPNRGTYATPHTAGLKHKIPNRHHKAWADTVCNAGMHPFQFYLTQSGYLKNDRPLSSRVLFELVLRHNSGDIGESFRLH